MPQLTFDQKFGEGLLARVGTGPGVYRYSDAEGVVIYVGKAKNLRRRLASYRNAGRKKAHRKMRRIVKAASSLKNMRSAGGTQTAPFNFVAFYW